MQMRGRKYIRFDSAQELHTRDAAPNGMTIELSRALARSIVH